MRTLLFSLGAPSLLCVSEGTDRGTARAYIYTTYTYMHVFILLGIGLERVRVRTCSELTSVYVRETCTTYCARIYLTYYVVWLTFFVEPNTFRVTAYAGTHVFEKIYRPKGNDVVQILRMFTRTVKNAQRVDKDTTSCRALSMRCAFTRDTLHVRFTVQFRFVVL